MYADPKIKRALRGKVVAGVVGVDNGEGDPWPGIRFTDGSVLVIQCDPEGNGPGFACLYDVDGNDVGGMG